MWQDREVRFDVSYTHMQLRLGEFAVDKLDLIEDTKGNAGENGRLIVTNLRIIWHSLLLPRINLSIGYHTVITVNSKIIHSLQGKHMQALHVLTSFRSCRYEFIFTNLDPKSTRHYTSVIGIYRAYISSKIYREIKLRSGIINDKQLILLPQERVHSTSPDIWNLSLEQGNIGTFIATNIRLVWFADMNYHFNVSMPYLIIANITIKNSKFGPSLVIASTESSGSYVLGFRVTPLQKLYALHKEILMLSEMYEKSPIFGVDYTVEHEASLQELNVEQYSELQDNQVEISNVFGYYFSEGSNQRNPSFSNYLGLAAENPRETSSLQSIWDLVPPS
ncbi:Bardet-Biedl syndrome 5 protein isoform X3 [Andrena cerasifolii]|uniref:Bardet-Biedl syndrome 5 protein isoform X3 n=1 Tax=Andrena cerasifolii TaxID=2819439 RepID=UPI004038407B